MEPTIRALNTQTTTQGLRKCLDEYGVDITALKDEKKTSQDDIYELGQIQLVMILESA